MIGREPVNEKERRAGDLAREDLNKDERLILIDAIRDLKHDMNRLEEKVDAGGGDRETLLSEIDSLKIRLFDIEKCASN